jgi:F-type H+-transporting ATPase subunit b
MPLASTTTTTTASNFLVPNGTFLAELVLFIIVLGFIAAFVLPPIMKVMRERDETIRGGLSAGEAGVAEAAALASERESALAAARAEARVILEEASRTAAAARADGQARGMAEHDRLLSEAVVVIEDERQRVVREVSARLGEVVVTAAERVVGAPVDLGRHRELLDQALAAIGESGTAEGGSLG